MSTVTINLRRRDLTWSLALILLLSAIWIARSDIAGAGGGPPPGEGIARVYIAVGTGFADALGAGPGAAANGAPIILVPTNPPLDPATALELVRLDPREVVIVGGTTVVSVATEAALDALLPNAVFSRIAGSNRYATNADFSAANFPIEGWASVPAVAFTADNPASDSVTVNLSFGYNSWDFALYAPIQLPHGAEILELKALMSDFDITNNATVTLYQVAASADPIASVATSGSPGFMTLSTTTIAAANAIVDNASYAYVLVASGVDVDPYLITAAVRYRLGASG